MRYRYIFYVKVCVCVREMWVRERKGDECVCVGVWGGTIRGRMENKEHGKEAT